MAKKTHKQSAHTPKNSPTTRHFVANTQSNHTPPQTPDSEPFEAPDGPDSDQVIDKEEDSSSRDQDQPEDRPKERPSAENMEASSKQAPERSEIQETALPEPSSPVVFNPSASQPISSTGVEINPAPSRPTTVCSDGVMIDPDSSR